MREQHEPFGILAKIKNQQSHFFPDPTRLVSILWCWWVMRGGSLGWSIRLRLLVRLGGNPMEKVDVAPDKEQTEGRKLSDHKVVGEAKKWKAIPILGSQTSSQPWETSSWWKITSSAKPFQERLTVQSFWTGPIKIKLQCLQREPKLTHFFFHIDLWSQNCQKQKKVGEWRDILKMHKFYWKNLDRPPRRSQV